MNALAPVTETRPARQIVEDVIPILDTARFEHMQRIATVMARSTLIPEALRTFKDGDKVLHLPFEDIMANCFLVVNQATKWNMDPFGVAQCVSIVKGKLCYEGKLVAAVLDAKLGIELSFTYDGKAGDALGVVVSGVINGVTKTVEGTVGGWKTTGSNSPWSSPSNHQRQLAYRGSREWARLHKPALMLGAYTDDELADLQDASRANRAREVAPPAPAAMIDPPAPPPAEPKKAEIEDATILSETVAGAPPPSQPAAPGAEASTSNPPAGEASASETYDGINPDDEIGNLIDKLAHAKDEATVEEWYVETDIEAALEGFEGYVKKAQDVRDLHLQRVRKMAATGQQAEAAAAPPPPPPTGGLDDDAPAPPPASGPDLSTIEGYQRHLQAQLDTAQVADDFAKIRGWWTDTRDVRNKLDMSGEKRVELQELFGARKTALGIA